MSDAVLDRIVEKMRRDPPRSKDDLEEIKRQACREIPDSGDVPKNREVRKALPDELRDRFEDVLRTKPVRTASGVAVLAVMSDPTGCPHGTCTFCPGGVAWDAPEGTKDTPQSYTGHEPAARRGGRHAYDPQAQTESRLETLETNGHATDKIDVIVMGGTFPARDPAYQDRFVKGIFDGLNRSRAPDLETAKRQNETADRRCIGLTVETKPDWCRTDHVDRMLAWGTTRVEIGIQTLDDDVLQATRRGHTVQDSRQATRIAKDAGLKVCHHVMPGLPGVDRERDLAMFRRLFEDPAFRPDMLKIYPTLVVPGTDLHDDWQAGRFEPIDDAEAADRIARMKAVVPPWVRIQRIDRDIPTHQIAAGVEKTNLRQLARDRLDELGGTCDCIRCREAGLKALKEGYRTGELELREHRYDASGGRETFLSFEDAEAVAAYLRLRLPDDPHRGELEDAAIVREVRVVGRAVPIGDDPDGATRQHRGLGRRLMAEAERRAQAAGCGTLATTSGVGTRAYYRKLGYVREGPYMVRELD